MLNKKCNNCGEEYSSDLKECPNCGFQNENGKVDEEILNKSVAPIDDSWVNTYLSKKKFTKIGVTIAFLLIVIISIIVAVINSNNESVFAIIGLVLSILMFFIWFIVLTKVKVYSYSYGGYTILIYSGIFDKSLIIEDEVIDSSLTHEDKVGTLPNGKEIKIEPYMQEKFNHRVDQNGKPTIRFSRKCKGYFITIDGNTNLMESI